MVRYERCGGEQNRDSQAKQPEFDVEFYGELGTEMWDDKNCLLQNDSVCEMNGGVGGAEAKREALGRLA